METKDYFSELDCDCIDLDAFYMEHYPDIYNVVRYLSNYTAALNILALHFIENKLDRNLIGK